MSLIFCQDMATNFRMTLFVVTIYVDCRIYADSMITLSIQRFRRCFYTTNLKTTHNIVAKQSLLAIFTQYYTHAQCFHRKLLTTNPQLQKGSFMMLLNAIIFEIGIQKRISSIMFSIQKLITICQTMALLNCTDFDFIQCTVTTSSAKGKDASLENKIRI